MNDSAVTIAGGGRSGLAAALAAAHRDRAAHVFERRREVGARVHGECQGLEHWSSEGDVLEEWESLGIAPTFSYTPFRECVSFDPDGREHVCRSSKPLWYLVRRGRDAGTLDQALKAQALAAGVELRCGEAVDHLPHGGIVAHGPRRVDAIAVGYVFATDRSDAAFGAVCDDLAPGGYAYLLICRGRATLATCMFDEFHNDKQYLARTVQFFERTVGVTPRDARAFGGFGNMPAEATLRRGNMLVAGEAVGLQDALFGFGMRYALVSGHRAGDAFATNELVRYTQDCRQRFSRAIRASAVNRYLYRRAGRRGYRTLVERVAGAADPRAWLKGYYNGRWWIPFVCPVPTGSSRAPPCRRHHGHRRSHCVGGRTRERCSPEGVLIDSQECDWEE